MTIAIRPAKQVQSKMRAIVMGPAGSGKTLFALRALRRLVGPDGLIVCIDTEKSSADAGASEVYADEIGHSIIVLDPPFRPQKFIDAIEAAIAAGAQGIVIDSITDEWSGEGGLIEWQAEINDKYWKTVKKPHNKLKGMVSRMPVHFICTQLTEVKTVFGDGSGKAANKAEQPIGPKEDFAARFNIDLRMWDGGNVEVKKFRHNGVESGYTWGPHEFEVMMDTFQESLAQGAMPDPTKAEFMASLTRYGFTKEDMVAAKKELDLPEWSVDNHEDLLAQLCEWYDANRT